MIRKPREWDEKCPQCAGTGTVHKREDFSLWTPEEYAALWPEGMPYERRSLASKYNIPTGAYECIAQGGSSIWDACREGVEIAKRLGDRAVVFEFNGAVAVCYAGSDPEQVCRAWRVRVNAA